MKNQPLVVYPRGFIGVVTAGLNKEQNEKTYAKQVIALRYNKLEEEESNDVYNLNVTKLYRQVMDSVLGFDKLLFTKAVVIQALVNFGHNDIEEWLGVQRQSRYFSLNHQRFILETFKFIQTGKRITSLRSWEIVIRRKSISDAESVLNNRSFDKSVAEFFSSNALDGKPTTSNLLRLIPLWLSHRGGAEDLLITLNIIFGKEFNK